MPQVNVTIAGRSYRLGCDEGQEDALAALAASVDERITAFREQFGEIGDMRLVIMTALAMADELEEARAGLADAARLQGAAEAERDAAHRSLAETEARSAAALDEAAERVERLTRALEADRDDGDDDAG